MVEGDQRHDRQRHLGTGGNRWKPRRVFASVKTRVMCIGENLLAPCHQNRNHHHHHHDGHVHAFSLLIINIIDISNRNLSCSELKVHRVYNEVKKAALAASKIPVCLAPPSLFCSAVFLLLGLALHFCARHLSHGLTLCVYASIWLSTVYAQASDLVGICLFPLPM